MGYEAPYHTREVTILLLALKVRPSTLPQKPNRLRNPAVCYVLVVPAVPRVAATVVYVHECECCQESFRAHPWRKFGEDFRAQDVVGQALIDHHHLALRLVQHGPNGVHQRWTLDVDIYKCGAHAGLCHA